MSSTESSGAPAEGTATSPAPDAAFPTFGTTRGSGLARGKRPAASAASASSAPACIYTPTAIEVVHAPREYTNPFAPAAEPAPVAEVPTTEVSAAPEVAPLVQPADVTPAPVPPAPVVEEPAQLNILPPAEQKSVPAQTWESDGFRPERAPRSERPRRDETPDEPVDIASIPEKFLYVRPGVTFVPTPRNWGGAPRERSERGERHRPGTDGASRTESDTPRAADSVSSAAPAAKPAGFLGWLKSLFGSAPAAEPVTAGTSSESQREGGERRHSRGGGGHGGPGGGHRRRRGGRSHHRPGGSHSGGPANT